MANLKNAYKNFIVIPEENRPFSIPDKEIIDELSNY
jgi:hypothetical protein